MTDRISKRDVAEVAAWMDVEPAALAAVLEVECGWPRRRGFDRQGRVRILYEPHIAYRLTRARAPAKLRPLLLKDLAYRRWGERKYPRSNAARWRQLEAAREIVGDLAYEFASYGLPQIMGFNHRRAGYASAREMVEAFATGEREQLEALGRFIRGSKSMLAALRGRHWARFARAYNGKGYKKNRYDSKLRTAYKRFASHKWPPPAREIEVAAAPPPSPPPVSGPRPTMPPPAPADPAGDSISGPAVPPSAASGPAIGNRRAGLFAALAAALAAAAGGIAAAWDWLVNFFH